MTVWEERGGERKKERKYMYIFKNERHNEGKCLMHMYRAGQAKKQKVSTANTCNNIIFYSIILATV